MKILVILYALTLCFTSTAEASSEPLFSGEVSSIDYYTTDISQSTGFASRGKQKVELKIYDHWVIIFVSWVDESEVPRKAQYIIPREKILKIVVDGQP